MLWFCIRKDNRGERPGRSVAREASLKEQAIRTMEQRMAEQERAIRLARREAALLIAALPALPLIAKEKHG
jgi:hypothetical protein